MIYKKYIFIHEQITNKIKGVKINYKGFYKYKYNLTTGTIKRAKKHYIIKNKHIKIISIICIDYNVFFLYLV